MNLNHAREWVTDEKPDDYIPGGGATAWIGLAFAAVALAGIIAALVWWIR